jgi:hypothetical protein
MVAHGYIYFNWMRGGWEGLRSLQMSLDQFHVHIVIQLPIRIISLDNANSQG